MREEKREFVRHPSSIPISVRLLNGKQGEVHLADISLGGLAFTYHWPIAVGVQIAVCVPSLADHIELSGRVVRCRGESPQWMIGVAFAEKEEVFRMRMVQQICHVEAYRQQVLEVENREISSDEAASEWIARNAAHFPRCGL